MPTPTQSAPAEGSRDDDDKATPAADGRSSDRPAEGGEDVAPRQPGSPQG